jgi:hypothetical protein
MILFFQNSENPFYGNNGDGGFYHIGQLLVPMTIRTWAGKLIPRVVEYPERRSAAPSVDHSLVALHRREYSTGRLRGDPDRGTAERGSRAATLGGAGA